MKIPNMHGTAFFCVLRSGRSGDIKFHRMETLGSAFIHNGTEREDSQKAGPQNAGPGVSGENKSDRIQGAGALGSA